MSNKCTNLSASSKISQRILPSIRLLVCSIWSISLPGVDTSMLIPFRNLKSVKHLGPKNLNNYNVALCL